MILLKEIISNLISETLESTQNQVAKLGYKIKPINGQRFAILVPRNERMNAIQDIHKRLGYAYDPKMKNVSSLGALISKDGIIVIVKPDNVQGGNSAGMANEAGLESYINEFLEQQSPLTIIFRAKNNIVEYKNIDQVRRVGSDTTGYKKADIQLLSQGEVVANLSLKQDNAEIWESADKRYGPILKKLIKKLVDKPFPDLGLRESDDDERIYRFYNPKTNQDYGGIVISDLPLEDEDQIIFGNDTPKTVVIKHTFQASDFNMIDEETLQIKAGMIFESMDDINGTSFEPILFIRHDKTRTASYGLRPLVYQKTRAYAPNGDLRGGKKEISYNRIK